MNIKIYRNDDNKPCLNHPERANLAGSLKP